jgi:hypothetical protein
MSLNLVPRRQSLTVLVQDPKVHFHTCAPTFHYSGAVAGPLSAFSMIWDIFIRFKVYVEALEWCFQARRGV